MQKPEKAGVAMLSSLVTFVQSVESHTFWHWILFQPHSHKLFLPSQSIEAIFAEGVTVPHKEFQGSHISSVSSLLCSSKRCGYASLYLQGLI